jgi:NAD kinase
MSANPAVTRIEKIVVVTRKTRLQELVERFNTLGQAKFYIEHAGGDFKEYVSEDDVYQRSVDLVRSQLNLDLKVQFVDRGFLPTFLFTSTDLVITLGQDGLVANTAKYVKGQPIIALNPDPERMDGVLLPYRPDQVRQAADAVLSGKARRRGVTMAQAVLNDGQSILAFNDLFIGARSHVSARYRIDAGGKSEQQSSSGILVSTGAGSSGWMSSVFNMARGLAALEHVKPPQPLRMKWEDPRLFFVAREPFVSRHSSAEIVAGMIEGGHDLCLESLMPSGGCIFSDGIEADFIEFNAGSIAKIHTAAQQAQLIVD